MDKKGMILLNPDSGNVISEGVATYRTFAQQEAYEHKKEMDKLKEHIKHNPKEKLFFKRFISVFDDINDLDSASQTRLMYLCTYMSYENRLEFDNGSAMKRKDITKIMNISSDACRKFLSTLKEKNYLIEKDDGFYFSNKIVHKGKDSDRPLNKNERYARIYIQAMRTLYSSVNSRQHKNLGYVFQVLPYVNIYSNILCSNPFESDKTSIRPMNMIDLVKTLGLSEANVTQFRKTLEDITFTFGGIEQHFLCYILRAKDENKNKGMIVINPNVMFGENDYQRAETILLFKEHDQDIKKATREDMNRIIEEHRQRRLANKNK